MNSTLDLGKWIAKKHQEVVFWQCAVFGGCWSRPKEEVLQLGIFIICVLAMPQQKTDKTATKFFLKQV